MCIYYTELGGAPTAAPYCSSRRTVQEILTDHWKSTNNATKQWHQWHSTTPPPQPHNPLPNPPPHNNLSHLSSSQTVPPGLINRPPMEGKGQRSRGRAHSHSHHINRARELQPNLSQHQLISALHRARPHIKLGYFFVPLIIWSCFDVCTFVHGNFSHNALLTTKFVHVWLHRSRPLPLHNFNSKLVSAIE